MNSRVRVFTAGFTVSVALIGACVSESNPPTSPKTQPQDLSASASSSAEELPVASASASSSAVVAAKSCAPIPPPPPLFSADPDLDKTPVPPIVDNSGKALDPFYNKLASVVRKTAKDHLKIAVYGDSNLTKDQFTGWMRRELQQRYGEGGHGYVASTKPWNWYLHYDVKHGNSGYKPYACSTHVAPDKYYGFAGISGDALQGKAYTYVETAGPEAPVGKTVSSFEVYYLKRPTGGKFDLVVDGQVKASVDSQSPVIEAAYAKVEVPDGPHRLDVVSSNDSKATRVFGTVLERSEPGVVIDSLGVGGASCPPFSKQDHATMVDTLRHRKHDLIIYALGSNYSDIDQLPGCMKILIDRHREAVPGIPIILFGPQDYMNPNNLADTSNMLNAARERMAKIASDNGCGFWDFRAAMGGPASVIKHVSRSMIWTDHIHFTDKGHHFMAMRFLHAIWGGLDKYIETHPEAGCPQLPQAPPITEND